MPLVKLDLFLAADVINRRIWREEEALADGVKTCLQSCMCLITGNTTLPMNYPGWIQTKKTIYKATHVNVFWHTLHYI